MTDKKRVPEDDSGKPLEDKWRQTCVIHCPRSECKGMLLTNPFLHELKCSDCGRLFMEIVEFKEVGVRR